MICAMDTSPEYQTFRQHYDELKTGLDPSSVVGTAFARDLLSREERNAASHTQYTDDEKLDKLLGAVERRIAVDKRAFHTFMEVLEEEPAFQHLVEKLKGVFIPGDVVELQVKQHVTGQYLLKLLLSRFRPVEMISLSRCLPYN